MIFDPLFILFVGITIVLGMIIILRANPFLSLLAAALTVSFMTPLPAGQCPETHVMNVCRAFGNMAGNIGILIAMGAIIGKCLLLSGSADRIILALTKFFGEKLIPCALLCGGFVLSIPVFYDTTLYLLIPIARSVYRSTKRNYLLYVMAIGLGATLSHGLIPPTPGPVAVAEKLGIPLGSIMIVSLLVGICTTPFAFAIAWLMNKIMPNPVLQFEDELIEEKNENQNDALNQSQKDAQSGIPVANQSEGNLKSRLQHAPSLFWSLVPIFLPVLLIASQTTIDLCERAGLLVWSESAVSFRNILRVLGNPQMALILAASVSMIILFRSRKETLHQLGKQIESALLGAGMIILITSAGGAFGEMLRQAKIGDRIQELFQGEMGISGTALLLLAFGVAATIKTAQGSSTTAMITTAAIFAGIIEAQSEHALPFCPAYLAAAIGLGSCLVAWMNDSGFWIFCKMGGIREIDALKTWSTALTLLGLSGLFVVLVLSHLLPLTFLK
ncbi:MAG: GntP family permease [Thermoguttaceae bacterium]